MRQVNLQGNFWGNHTVLQDVWKVMNHATPFSFLISTSCVTWSWKPDPGTTGATAIEEMAEAHREELDQVGTYYATWNPSLLLTTQGAVAK